MTIDLLPFPLTDLDLTPTPLATLELLPMPTSVTPNPTWAQATWYIDPQNRTGLAFDGNSGINPSSPVLTWNGGVIEKYGTIAPQLSVPSVTWNWLSGSPTDGSDPVIFTPTLSNNVLPIMQGQFAAAQKIGSGVVTGFVPKNYTTGQLTAADLGSAGAVTVGMFIVNTTAGKASAAWTRRVVSGSVFELYQPLSRTVVPFVLPTLVDTWANGDTFDVYLPDSVQLALCVPTFADTNSRFYVQQMRTMASSTPGASSPSVLGDGVALQEVRSDRRLTFGRAAFSRNFVSVNSIFTEAGGFGVVGGPTTTAKAIYVNGVPHASFYGGGGGVDATGCLFDASFAIESLNSGGSEVVGCCFGIVYLATLGMIAEGHNVLTSFGYGTALWGPGVLNIDSGRMTLVPPNTAVGTLLNLAGVQLNSQTTANTATREDSPVFTGLTPVTPANIDANNGPGGVGMFLAGGGSISNIV